VSTIPANPATQARRELGLRLRQIRKAAGLTGQELAEATGQHFTRISRIENGAQPPTERNIRDWCAACGTEDQAPDLIASARVTESAYLEWGRQSRAGLKHLGTLHSIATYRRTTSFRIHEPIVLPGIFQTEAYIRRMLAYWYDFLGAPDDTDATIAAKAERTAAALDPAKRISVVLGEQALRTRYGTPAEHAGQLTHILALARLPFVDLAVIPADTQRHAMATIGFWIFDDNAVALETPTAAMKITRPTEVAQYTAMFGHLHDEAIHGHHARQFIAAILASYLGKLAASPAADDDPLNG
jgi:transcriptional regulator with XRE-family HTH domain